MESRFKTRITRLFRGSLASCRTQNISDVIEKSAFRPQQQKNFNFIDPLPIKARPFPSICRHKYPESTTTQPFTNSIFRRRKVSDRYLPLISSANTSSRRSHCHSASSPAFPLNPFYKKTGPKERKKNSSSNSKKDTRKKKKNPNTIFSSTSQDSAYFGGRYNWFSSEIDEEIEAEKNRANDESDTLLFSSRSLSSDSSGSFRRRRQRQQQHHRKKQSSTSGGKRRPASSVSAGNYRRKQSKKQSTAVSSDKVGVFPILDGKVKGSFAVVKSSSDPYNDFRTSMVAMIVEKQIFGAKYLEHLLQCFLSLNSNHHHKIIVEVFTEICETLFSNWY